MDATLGRRVLDHVTAHRDQFDMTIWVEPNPACGSTACLAGWTLLLSGYGLDSTGRCFKRPDGSWVPKGDISGEAARLLRLTAVEHYGAEGESSTLFAAYDENVAIERFRRLVEAAEAGTTGQPNSERNQP